MNVQDLIITPIYFLLLLVGAFLIRPFVTNRETRPYFMPGILFKFVGAIALGMIYQFYYNGGDTYTFHTHGSRWIWQAFIDNPQTGLKIMLGEAGVFNGSIYDYTSKIWLYRDPSSLFVIKISTFFDLFTFSTYSSTALFFALFAFSGHWALYVTFQKMYPDQNKYLALACLFVPSVIFWGSGLLKDSITLGSLCWMTHALFQITIRKKRVLFYAFIIVFFGWIIYSIKIYILLSFLAATSVYLYALFSKSIDNTLFRFFARPVLIIIFMGIGYVIINQISKNDSRYALDKIAQTAMVTAYDIRYGWGARYGDNSGYTLGEIDMDNSFTSMLALAPQGIVVTLFRPWLWEVKNPLMLLAALESLAVLILTCVVILRMSWAGFRRAIRQPTILYLLCFSLLFAFAVGVSTFNFGTLMRYKIPAIPFYVISLVLLNKQKNIV